MVHGNTPAEVEQDLEGMQVMRFLGRNMAYFLKCIEAGRKAGVPLPREEGRKGMSTSMTPSRETNSGAKKESLLYSRTLRNSFLTICIPLIQSAGSQANGLSPIIVSHG